MWLVQAVSSIHFPDFEELGIEMIADGTVANIAVSDGFDLVYN